MTRKKKAAKKRAQSRRRTTVVVAPRRRTRVRLNRVGRVTAGRGVALNNSMVPRSWMRSSKSGTGKVFVVEGQEVFCTVTTPADSATETNSQVVQIFSLNPGYPWFRRLSAFAQAFQKFRFRRVQFHYHPACPTTRSGIVSLAHLENPLETIPNSPPDYASYDTSFTGSIGIPMATAVDRERDSQWYYTTNRGETGAASDPTKFEQGKICVMCGGSVTADLELLAGYVSISYVVEFDELRPVRDVCLTVGPRPDFTISGGAEASIPWTTWLAGLGDFGWSPTKAAWGNPASGLGSSQEDNFFLDTGSYLLDYLLDWGAASMDEKSVLSPRPRAPLVFAQQRSVMDRRRKVTASRSGWRWRFFLNESELLELPVGYKVIGSAPCGCISDGIVRRTCTHDWWWSEDGLVVRPPNAAGDIIVTWHAEDNNGTDSSLSTVTFSLGVGAVATRYSLEVALGAASDPYRIWVTVDTDGTETRVLDEDDSFASWIVIPG